MPALVFVALVLVAGVKDRPLQLLRAKYNGQVAPFSPVETEADWVTEYRHGWPTPWLRRALEFGGPGGLSYRNRDGGTTADPPWRLHGLRISWSSPYSWPLTSHASRLYPLGVAINLLLMACLVGLPMLATETWLHRRGGLGRFKIIDFLAVVALCAVGFGFWRWDKSITDREQSALVKLNLPLNRWKEPAHELAYIGPEWASRLLGNPDIVPVLQRIVEINTDFDDVTNLDPAIVGQFDSLERLRIGLQPYIVMNHLTAVEDLRDIRELSLSYHDIPIPVSIIPPPQFDLSFLAGLSHIEKLDIQLRVLIDDLAALGSMPRLKELRLSSEWITNSEFESLRARLPHVRISSHSYSQKPPVRDLQIALCRYERAHYRPPQHARASLLASRCPERCDLDDEGTELLLPHIPITSELQAILEPNLPQITSFKMCDVDIAPEAHLMIAAMTSLEIVEVQWATVPDEFLLQVLGCPRLEFVTLKHARVALDPLLELEHREGVALKVVGDCGLTAEEMQRLSQALGDRFTTN